MTGRKRTSHLSKTIVISLLTLFLSVSHPLAQWQRIASPRFQIHYHHADLKNAQKVLRKLEDSYPSAISIIGYELPKEPISIFICASQKEFDQVTGGRIPHWGAGVADVHSAAIFLKSPRFSRDNIGRIAVHELSHILLGKASAGRPLPRWFDEGMADYLAGRRDWNARRVIATAVRRKSILWLTEIDSVLTFREERARLAYLESSAAIAFILEEFGPEALRKIVSGVKAGKDFDDALKAALELDLDDFENSWYAYLQQKYKWDFLANFETYLWVLFPLLVISAIIIIKIRNRRTVKRWQEEERREGFES